MKYIQHTVDPHLSNHLCRASKIMLLMLVVNFMFNFRLKTLNGISVESMECHNKVA